VVKHNLRRALFSCTLLASLTTTGASGVQLPKAAAYLTFDEGNGTLAADSSGNNNNATLIGAAGWATGFLGRFDLGLPGVHGSYAQIPGDVVDTTKSYTVAAWVKLNTVGKVYQTFVSEDGDGQSAFFLQLRGDTNQFSFTILYGFSTLPQSGFTPVIGVWYHLAVCSRTCRMPWTRSNTSTAGLTPPGVGDAPPMGTRPRFPPDLNAALGDAAWLTGLERNSDVVLLEAYAPMLVNVNSGASQWPTNLIGYDALQSYGSPSYYVQQMFSGNHGDVVLPSTLTTTGNGSEVYASVTRDSGSGTIYLKVVNMAGEGQPLKVTIDGGDVASAGQAIVLTSRSPQDANTLTAPRNIVPVTSRAGDLGRNFEYRFQPYSVTVLQIGAGRNDRSDASNGGDSP
jgi:hypothetical protein